MLIIHQSCIIRLPHLLQMELLFYPASSHQSSHTLLINAQSAAAVHTYYVLPCRLKFSHPRLVIVLATSMEL